MNTIYFKTLSFLHLCVDVFEYFCIVFGLSQLFEMCSWLGRDGLQRSKMPLLQPSPPNGSRARAQKTGKKFLHWRNGTINKLPLKSSCDTLHSDNFDDDVSLSALKLIIKGQESEGQGAKIPSSVAAWCPAAIFSGKTRTGGPLRSFAL